MKNTSKLFCSMFATALLLVLLVGASGVVGAAEVEGNASGTMVGYGDDANSGAGEFPNEINVRGEMTVRNEAAVNPEIIITSGTHTILDVTSVDVFVDGEESIEFEVDPNTVTDRVVIRPVNQNQIPTLTPLIVEFTTYFTGGTETDNLSAGEVTLDYETPGGVSESATFVADTDSTNSADNVIAEQKSELGLQTWEQRAAWVGYITVAAIIIVFVIWLILKVTGSRNGGGTVDVDE